MAQQTETTFRNCRWLVLIICCILGFTSWGLALGMASVLPDVMDTFQVPRAQAALVQSSCLGLCLMGGIVFGPLLHRFGPRVTVVMGSLLATLGSLMAYFAEDIVFVIIGMGALTGAGVSSNFLSGQVLIPLMFHNVRSVVMTLFAVSSSVGSIVYPHFLRYLVDVYHLRGAYLIAGAINLQMVLFGVLVGVCVRDSRTDNRTEGDEATTETHEDEHEGAGAGVESQAIFTLSGNGLASEPNAGPSEIMRHDHGVHNDGSAEKKTIPEERLDVVVPNHIWDKIHYTTTRRQGSKLDDPGSVRLCDHFQELQQQLEQISRLSSRKLVRRQASQRSSPEDEHYYNHHDGPSTMQDVSEEQHSTSCSLDGHHRPHNAVNGYLSLFSDGKGKAARERRSEEQHSTSCTLCENRNGLPLHQRMSQMATANSETGHVSQQCDLEKDRREHLFSFGKQKTSEEQQQGKQQQQQQQADQGTAPEATHDGRCRLASPPQQKTGEQEHHGEDALARTQPEAQRSAEAAAAAATRKSVRKPATSVHLRIFGNGRFAAFTILVVLPVVVLNSIPLLFLVDLATAAGLSVEDGSFFLSLLAFGLVVGPLLSGASYYLLGPRITTAHSVSSVTLGVASFCFTIASTYTDFVALSVMYGLCSSFFTSCIAMTTLEIVGRHQYAVAMGIVNFSGGGLGMLISGPLGGTVRDLSGSFGPLLCSAMVQGMLSGCVLLAISLWSRLRRCCHRDSYRCSSPAATQ